MSEIEIRALSALDPFEFRWPDGVEAFESGWSFELWADRRWHAARHAIGAREVYGRVRVHTVTWIDGQVQVEGVESDDYPTTQTLISRLRKSGRGLVRQWEDVPPGYEGFTITEHRREIDAPYVPQCLAVKIREDDLESWGQHAWLRSQLPRRPSASGAVVQSTATARGPAVPASAAPSALPAAPSPNAEAVGRALLAHAERLADQLKSGTVQFTPDPQADAFVREDPFAFLIAVIADMGIRAERAWAMPYELKQRLGHLHPSEIASDPAAVRAAIQRSPKLHRFVNLIPNWVVEAARLILDRDDGDAARLWSDTPTAAELRRRLEAFPGIGQKKAAMAVEILARDLGKPLRQLSGSDVAYDVHLRRVFLRTGLADRDDVGHMVAVARELYPNRPGALDLPAWDIGRRWCRATGPDCPACPLVDACARLISKGDMVKGV